jgi:Cdc6-like AAA superfamily ATPase
MKRKRTGKELRRARNICRKWMNTPVKNWEAAQMVDFEHNEQVADHIEARRYKKACALILAHQLRS